MQNTGYKDFGFLLTLFLAPYYKTSSTFAKIKCTDFYGLERFGDLSLENVKESWIWSRRVLRELPSFQHHFSDSDWNTWASVWFDFVLFRNKIQTSPWTHQLRTSTWPLTSDKTRDLRHQTISFTLVQPNPRWDEGLRNQEGGNEVSRRKCLP